MTFEVSTRVMTDMFTIALAIVNIQPRSDNRFRQGVARSQERSRSPFHSDLAGFDFSRTSWRMGRDSVDVFKPDLTIQRLRIW